MTLVKICGITNLDDALAAVDAGADMLGFNFYERSPRYINPKDARFIIDQLPQHMITVGVFVNAELEAIEKIVSTSGVLILQLHGDESPEYCKTLRSKGHTLIKVFNTGEGFTLEQTLGYDDDQWIMMDAGGGTVRGGTGQLSDWSQAQQAKLLFPITFLAGGLSPENVVAAIDEVEPFGVDACSSLEQVPGKKDHARLRDFVTAIRTARPHPPKCPGQKTEGIWGILERWRVPK
jgi:phosphoribosylanthranilate isomerase